MSTGEDTPAVAIAEAIRARRASAREVVASALERIARRDAALNCFTRVLDDTAVADAERIDRLVAAGGDPGPLAGVPFAVKNARLENDGLVAAPIASARA